MKIGPFSDIIQLTFRDNDHVDNGMVVVFIWVAYAGEFHNICKELFFIEEIQRELGFEALEGCREILETSEEQTPNK